MRVCLCNYRTLLLLRETQLEQLRVQGGGVSFVFHVARQTTGIAVSSFASAVKHSLTSVNSDLSLLALNRRPYLAVFGNISMRSSRWLVFQCRLSESSIARFYFPCDCKRMGDEGVSDGRTDRQTDRQTPLDRGVNCVSHSCDFLGEKLQNNIL